MKQPNKEQFDKYLNEQFEKFGKEVEITCRNKAKQTLNRCFNKYWDMVKEMKNE